MQLDNQLAERVGFTPFFHHFMPFLSDIALASAGKWYILGSIPVQKAFRMKYLTAGKADRYHYRRAVPDDLRILLGRREWKVTFKATSARVAEHTAFKLAADHDADIARERARGAATVAALSVRAAAKQWVEDKKSGSILDHSMRVKAAAKVRRDKIYDEQVPNGARLLAESALSKSELQLLRAELSLFEKAVAGVVGDRFTALEEAVFSKLMGSDSARLAVTKDAGPLLTALSAHSLRDHLQTLREKISGEEVRLTLLTDRLPRIASTATAVVTDDLSDKSVAELPILTALPKWLKAESPAPITSHKYTVYIRRFAEFTGNPAINNLRKSQVSAFIEYLKQLPDSNRVPPSDRAVLSMEELISRRESFLAANGRETWPLITSATINKHLECIRSFLSWVASAEDDFVNVAKDVRRKKETRRPSEFDVRAFTAEQWRNVLDTSAKFWPRGTDIWWIIRLAALTGARLEELCQLATANVRVIDSIAVIEISAGDFSEHGVERQRKVKNAMSERLIPIHPKILSEGFLDFVGAKVGPRVFSSVRRSKFGYGHNVSKSFQSMLRTHAGVADKRLRFHSLRHGFVTALHNASVRQVQINALVGHARARGAAGRYIDELALPLLLEAVKQVDIQI